MSINNKNFKDNDLYSKLYISNSKIEGKGVFAKEKLNKDENLGVALVKISESGNPDKDYFRTDLGAFVNHSNSPNCKVKREGDKIYYITLKKVNVGEEILINYKEFDFEGKRDFVN
jgi:SET domain-containing protein